MNQAQFEARHERRWREFAAWLDGGVGAAAIAPRDWPQRYRQIAHHLALARDRAYGPELVDRLQHLALAGHQALYGSRGNALAGLVGFVGSGFPALVRRESVAVAVAAALLFVPLLGLIALLLRWPELVHYLIPQDQLASYEAMYAPGNRALGPRHGAESQLMMFGYYVWNNVKIDFQCFAGGLLFGVGAVFFMVYNGVMIGAVAGHLTQLGLIPTFWGFVAGHSSWELLGAAISGAAGLKLGWALIAPGAQPRLAALRAAGRVAVRLLYGAAGMTLGAAFIEAFWSSMRSIPAEVKYGVGILFWGLFALYFAFAGRGRGRAEGDDAH
ncbi:MAG: stage II sporulation protein M [Burkholderiales bacterium]|nr:stage II sporulation protein M [Burkholderiales bacterium]